MKNLGNFVVTKNTQFAVLGLGRFGKSIAKVLSDNNYNVLCCDNNPVVVHEVSQYATHVIQADVTDETVLDSIGLGNFDVVIVSLSHDFEASVITTMIAKERNVPFVLAKARGVRQKKILESLGADRVVLPEKEIGEKIAFQFITNDPMDHIRKSDEYDVMEIKPKEEWIGKSLAQLSLRKKESINVLAIVRNDAVMAVLDPDLVIEKHDELVVLHLL